MDVKSKVGPITAVVVAAAAVTWMWSRRKWRHGQSNGANTKRKHGVITNC